ncbi:hypothetical protein HDU78_008109 [Chytriomyces hyalinus]|nr:hypothetical protein HDU78_008109 [Chytriomyces hyalinus]
MSDRALAIKLEEARNRHVAHRSAMADFDKKSMYNKKLFFALKDFHGQCDELDELCRLATNQKALRLAMAENYDQIQKISAKLNDDFMNGEGLSLGSEPFLRMNVRELYMHLNSDSLGCTHGFVESAAGLETLRPARERCTRLPVPQGLVAAYVGRYSDDYFVSRDDAVKSPMSGYVDTEVDCISKACLI